MTRHKPPKVEQQKEDLLDLDSAIKWRSKALSLEQQMDWDGLKSHSVQWKKVLPRDANAWNSLGKAYYKSGQFDKAIDVTGHAIMYQKWE